MSELLKCLQTTHYIYLSLGDASWCCPVWRQHSPFSGKLDNKVYCTAQWRHNACRAMWPSSKVLLRIANVGFIVLLLCSCRWDRLTLGEACLFVKRESMAYSLVNFDDLHKTSEGMSSLYRGLLPDRKGQHMKHQSVQKSLTRWHCWCLVPCQELSMWVPLFCFSAAVDGIDWL